MAYAVGRCAVSRTVEPSTLKVGLALPHYPCLPDAASCDHVHEHGASSRMRARPCAHSAVACGLTRIRANLRAWGALRVTRRDVPSVSVRVRPVRFVKYTSRVPNRSPLRPLTTILLGKANKNNNKDRPTLNNVTLFGQRYPYR